MGSEKFAGICQSIGRLGFSGKQKSPEAYDLGASVRDFSGSRSCERIEPCAWCFCQFKIDQARQLNFDQGLKPVF